jgi:hypothetical protein
MKDPAPAATRFYAGVDRHARSLYLVPKQILFGNRGNNFARPPLSRLSAGVTGNVLWIREGGITMFRFMFQCVAAGVVGLGLACGGTAQASSYDCAPVYKKVVCYQTVTTYETRCEPYKVCVVRYDHCGNAYSVTETRYREVKVPVQKQVAVVKYVKAYD